MFFKRLGLIAFFVGIPILGSAQSNFLEVDYYQLVNEIKTRYGVTPTYIEGPLKVSIKNGKVCYLKGIYLHCKSLLGFLNGKKNDKNLFYLIHTSKGVYLLSQEMKSPEELNKQ